MRRITSTYNPDFETSNNTYIASQPAYTLAGYIQLFYNQYKYILILIGILILMSLWLIFNLNRQLKTRKRAAELYKWIENEIINSTDQLLMESSIKRRLANVHGLEKTEVAMLWPYIQREADYKQNVEYIQKSENGIDERGWWIQQDSSRK